MFILVQFVQLVFLLLQIAILLRVLFSFVSPNPYNPLVRLVVQVTDPILDPLRRIIPPIGMFDISPMVAFIIVNILERVIVMLLIGAF